MNMKEVEIYTAEVGCVTIVITKNDAMTMHFTNVTTEIKTPIKYDLHKYNHC